MLNQIIAQTDKAARLLEQSIKANANVRGLRSGDRVFTPLVGAVEFSQGNAPSANIVFNVPADADFWAYRLLLEPYCKIVDPVNGSPDEVAYRSTSFSFESESTGVPGDDDTYSDFNTLVDGTFAIIYQGKERQNIDVPFAAAYGANIGKWLGDFGGGASWGGASQTPGGFVFDIPQFLPRGQSLVCRITPTFLGTRTIEDEWTPTEGESSSILRQHKYKIVGVLEGEKRVNALR